MKMTKNFNFAAKFFMSPPRPHFSFQLKWPTTFTARSTASKGRWTMPSTRSISDNETQRGNATRTRCDEEETRCSDETRSNATTRGASGMGRRDATTTRRDATRRCNNDCLTCRDGGRVGGIFFDKQNRTRNPGQRRLAQFAHSLSRRQQGQPQTNVRLA